MNISKEITRLEHSNVKLTLTIPKEDVLSEYDALISEYSKSLQLPGFRKGKVPRDVLIRKFGDALKQDAMGKIIEKGMIETLENESFSKEDHPLPYSTPEIEKEPKLDLENDLQFSVIYDVMPKLTVEKWEGFEVEAPEVSIDDEDINRELETIRERNAFVLDKDDDEKAANNDVVTVNYCELDEDDNVIEGTARENFAFTLGSGHNYYKFDEEVLGMKKGESKDFEKTYPEDFEIEDLKGKTKKLRLDLTALKLKRLPDLDDDLAQDVDEKFETLEDLKNNIRERLSKSLEERLRSIKISNLLEKMMENAPVVIPESMVRLELDSRWRNLARRFNMDSEGLFKMMGQGASGAEGAQNIQGILDQWRPDTIRALHSRLIVETLMEDLKLEATDKDVEEEIEKIAASDGVPVEDVSEYYKEESVRNYLKEDIKERRLFDMLLEKNTIKPGNKSNYVDLMANND